MSHYLRRVRSVGLLPGTPYFALPSLSRFSIGNHSESFFFFLQSFFLYFPSCRRPKKRGHRVKGKQREKEAKLLTR